MIASYTAVLLLSCYGTVQQVVHNTYYDRYYDTAVFTYSILLVVFLRPRVFSKRKKKNERKKKHNKQTTAWEKKHILQKSHDRSLLLLYVQAVLVALCIEYRQISWYVATEYCTSFPFTPKRRVFVRLKNSKPPKAVTLENPYTQQTVQQ